MSSLRVWSPCWWSSSCQGGGHGNGIELSLEERWELQSWNQALLRCRMILGSPSLATGTLEAAASK